MYRSAASSLNRRSLAHEVVDPFSVNPIRRAVTLIVVCAAIVFGPWLLSRDAGEAAMVSVGWLALTGLVFGVPILAISLCEEAHRRIRSRLHPPVETLGLSPRVCNILRRHGYETVSQVESLSDASLMLMSNMDERGLREVRRQVAIWQYRLWQDKGFPIQS